MNFVSYSDCAVTLAVDLVNTLDVTDGSDGLTEPSVLRELLAEHEISGVGRVTREDVEDVRGLRSRLRAIFESSDERAAVEQINALVAQAGALPQLTDHDGEPWHLHFAPPGVSLVDRLTVETAMGLAVVLRDHGFDRLRVCAGDSCDDVFVDTSRNRSRRYCRADVCGNRAHVAAYRARQRAGA